MANWKTDLDTIPLHTVLIISDQPENVRYGTAFLIREIVLFFPNRMFRMPCKAQDSLDPP